MKSFKLEIYTPNRAFFQGEVEFLSLVTPNGEMGVYHNTLPIVASLAPGVLKIRQNNRLMEAANGEGFIEIGPQGTVLLTQSAEWPYEINYDQVQSEINDINDKIKKEQSIKEYKIAKAQLARHFARLRLKKRDLD